MRLRQRLNSVLLVWVGLLTVMMGAVWLVAVPGLRLRLIDDRLLLAHAVSHGLDATLSSSMVALGRLSADLPDDPVALAGRLHQFRFQSPFRDAVYLLDGEGRLVNGDPAHVTPIDRSWLGPHEVITPLVRKSGSDDQPVLAAIQPFKRDGTTLFLVAEMFVRESAMAAFFKELTPPAGMHMLLVDTAGVVVAARDPARVLTALPGATAFGDRIRANRPLVLSESAGTLAVMAPLRFAAWGVVIEQAGDSAFAGLDAVGRALMVTALALSVLGVLLVRTLSRSVVTPIRHLSKQADAMSAGDLESPITVSGDMEVAALARTLDTTRARLARTLDRLRAFNEQLEGQVEARTRVIEEQHEERKQLVQRMLHATEDERRRLARELHDEIAQLLTVVQLSLARLSPETPALAEANALLERTQGEIHRLIHDLRPSLLDDLGLAAAMASYADDLLGRHGVRVSLEIEEGLPSMGEIETVVFRIYQELLTNVLRHADADQVSVELYRNDRTLVLVVEDDGVGFDPAARSGRAGLTGMRERAGLVNGTIVFDSEVGAGTQVRLEIPLP